jgi:hypothetical protein
MGESPRAAAAGFASKLGNDSFRGAPSFYYGKKSIPLYFFKA